MTGKEIYNEIVLSNNEYINSEEDCQPQPKMYLTTY
jgi:hypothetical protein